MGLPTETYDVVNVDAIAATIRQQESNNNYTIRSKNSTASGAYQFLDTTWSQLAQQYAANVPDARMYRSAADAPPATQDAIAKHYIEDILAQNGNNVAAVPATWYVGSWSYAEAHANDIPAGNSISVSDYVNKWLQTFHTISGQSPGNANIISGVSGVVSNAGDIASTAWAGITSPLQFFEHVWSALTTKSNWVRVGLVVGALLLTVFGLYIVSKSLGGPSAGELTGEVAKGFVK
jgi:hypothetical protein